MRSLLATVALLLSAAPALAGGAEEFFMGRPPSVGVVQGGAFGGEGFDYLGEMRRRPSPAPHATQPPRSGRRLAHVEHGRRHDEPSVVARPYFRP